MSDVPPDLDLEGLPKWVLEALDSKREAPHRLSIVDHRGTAEWPLFVEAAMVASFLPRDLAPEMRIARRDEAEKAVLGFAELTHDENGTKWSLTPEARREVLNAIDSSEVTAAARRTALRFPDPLSHALRSCLTSSGQQILESADLKTLEVTRIAATWLTDVTPATSPPLDELDREIARRRQLTRFARMVGESSEPVGSQLPNRFHGRRKEMETLREYVGVVAAESFLEGAVRVVKGAVRRLTGRTPLNVLGLGGVGKTTLIAKFMLEHAQIAASRFPFAYLDFDRSTISASNRPALLIEICQQIGAQFAELTEETARIAAAIASATRHITPGSSDDSITVLMPFAQELRHHIDVLLDSLESRFESARPFLLVFDTFEVVQYGPDQVEGLEQLVRAFSDANGAIWPRLRLIISGRRKVPEFLGEPEPLPLGALDRKGSAEMLQALTESAGKPIKIKDAQRIVDAIVKSVGDPSAKGVQPLRLRLIGEVFTDRQNHSDGPAIAKSLLDELAKPPSQSGLAGHLLVDGILVRRILGHVVDGRVRALADPGLVVRRISAEVIEKVMTRGTSKPSDGDPLLDVSDNAVDNPWIVTESEAKSIFNAFRKEVTLVEEDGDDLRHRQDVRQEMLPLIQARRPKRFRALHQLAYDHFRGKATTNRRDHASAAEAIYHGLWLELPIEALDPLWSIDPIFDARIDPEEFKEGSLPNVYVRAKKNSTLEPEEIERLPRPIALTWLSTKAEDLLRNRRLNKTIDALRIAAGGDFSALDDRIDTAAVVARLLYRAGLWQDAALLLRRHLQRETVAELMDLPTTSRPDGKRMNRLEPLLSLARTWATIAGRSGAPREELSAALDVAEYVGDAVVHVGMLTHIELGLRQHPATESTRTRLQTTIAESVLDVPRNRWAQELTVLRLAILSCQEFEHPLRIYIETVQQLPRDFNLIGIYRELFPPEHRDDDRLAVIGDALRGDYAGLDRLWREEKGRFLENFPAYRLPLRTLVAYDHTDWIQPLGNALTRVMTKGQLSRRQIPGFNWNRTEFDRALSRRDGPALAQAASDAGGFLEFAKFIAEQNFQSNDSYSLGLENWLGKYRYPNGASDIAAALLRWHEHSLPDRRSASSRGTWSHWLTQLNDVLADLYPAVNESRRIVACAQMKTALIEFGDMALVNWFNILNFTARSHGNRPGHPPKALAILDCALKDYGDNEILLALKRDEPPVIKGPDLAWVPEPDESHLEKIIGAQSRLLPIPFLEIAMQRARSVARVVLSDHSSATGFLIGKGWLLTNNHVLPSPESAQDAIAEMNYQQTADSLGGPVERFPLDPSRFYTSKSNDWTVIGVDPAAQEKWGFIELAPVETARDRFINIIHHPGGGPKQIGLYHNMVTYVGEGRVQYLTDTLPVSSGAPVFDDQWRVVALHHSGGMLREPGTKTSFYRNEGIAITTVIDDLRAAGIT